MQDLCNSCTEDGCESKQLHLKIARSALLHLQDSPDPTAQQAKPSVQTGHKWRVEQAVDQSVNQSTTASRGGVVTSPQDVVKGLRE